MRGFLGFGLAALVAAVGLAGAAGGQESAAKKNRNLGKVRHVVLFKFKDGTAPEEIKAIEAAFRALPKKIPQIQGYEWGTNMSPENINQGFTTPICPIPPTRSSASSCGRASTKFS